jgi:hypothetical protein
MPGESPVWSTQKIFVTTTRRAAPLIRRKVLYCILVREEDFPMCQLAVSRRGFFQRMAFGSMARASILDMAWRRAAWAQALTPGAAADLFEIQNVADGVYFAFARPQAVGELQRRLCELSRRVSVGCTFEAFGGDGPDPRNASGRSGFMSSGACSENS